MKVSIITASYNCENTIKETIDSVLNQTFKDWELIVIDDGSADNSKKIIQEYCSKDPRIKLYTHANNENKGLKSTVQLGVSKASFEWLHFVECDDILKPDAIENKIEIIKKYPNVSLVFSEVETFGDKHELFDNSNYMRSRIEFLKHQSYPSKIISKSPSINVIPTFSCVLCRKDILMKCSFNTPIDAYLDWFLWSQIAQEDVYYIDKPLTLWRISPTSYAQTFKGRFNGYITGRYNLIIRQNIMGISSIQRKTELFIYAAKYIIKQIFSISNSNNKKHKIITILGLKLKIKKQF